MKRLTWVRGFAGMNSGVERESNSSRAAVGTAVTDKVSPLRIAQDRQESVLGSGLLINYLVLAAFFLLSLVLRLWMLDKRWINPDEGAHLMDALLTLQGFIPQIDFGARQTFYVLANAVWLKLWGASYLYGRLFPMTCSLLTGIMVFLIARKLFNQTVALIAAVLYLMLPLEILNSVVVKTEPLANLLACSSFYLLLLYSGGRNRAFLLLAGLLAALGYYVRESLLVLAVLGLIFIATERDRSISETARSIGWFILGYGLVVLTYLAFYVQFTGADDLLYGSSNPVGFVLRAVEKFGRLLLVKFGLDAGGAGEASKNLGTKTIYSFHYLRWTVFLHPFLFVGIVWAAFRVVFRGGERSHLNPQFRRSYFLALSWVVLLGAAYIYHYKTFGYYIDYFREFLPILVIIFAAYVWETIFQESQRKTILYSLIIGVAGLAAVFLVEKFVIDISKGIQVVAVIGAVALVMVNREKLGRRKRNTALLCVVALVSFYFLCRAIEIPHRNIALVFTVGGIIGITVFSVSNRLRFINVSLILSFFFLSTTFAATIMGMRYDSVWSNEAVEEIASSIKENSDLDDEVMSGAVIWEFESHRRPFAMISHPLTYSYKMSAAVTSKIEQEMRKNPPQIIVLDGYTEKIYLKHLNWLQEVLDNRYELILKSDEAKYTVQVYRLSKGA